MLNKLLLKLTLLLAITISASSVMAAELPVCSTTISIEGLPTSSTSVEANTPVSWDIKITGGLGFDATSYTIDWLSATKNGIISENWTKYAGHYAEMTITYTPNDTFEAGDTEDLSFEIVHGYGDCTSEVQRIRIHEKACNGPVEVLGQSWSSTPINVNWGGKWEFYVDIHTWDAASSPSYNIVKLNNLPNLGIFSYDSLELPPGGLGKRLKFSYQHAESSSGDDEIRFLIVDNAIVDSEDRQNCATSFEIPLNIKEKPADFYCSGLGATTSVVPALLDVGGTATITVQGTPGSKSSGNYTYKVVGTLENGTIPLSQQNETGAMTSSQEYTYTHTGGYGGDGDTLAVEIKDSEYPECKVTKNIDILVKNYCSGISVSAPEFVSLDRATEADLTLSVSGGTGTYRFQITSMPSNGTIIGDGVDSGWVTQDSYTFSYLHNGDSYLGDDLVVTVEDQTYGCKYTVTVPMRVVNPCEGFGIGDNTETVVVMNADGTASITVYAEVGNGSGTFIYSVGVSPEHGTIVGPTTSGTTSDTSFTFYYQHNMVNETPDTFTVVVQDAVYGDCSGQEVIYLEFIDHCEAFDASISPSSQTIDVGQSYTFTVTATGSSNQFQYTIIDTSPETINGVITTDISSGVISSGYTFGYTHDPNKPNSGAVIHVIAEDTVYDCQKTVKVTFKMKNHCASMSYAVNNDYYDVGRVDVQHGQILNIDVTVVGGSGDFTIDIPASKTYTWAWGDDSWTWTYHYYRGVLTEVGRTENDGSVIVHYEYDNSGYEDYPYVYFYPKITDNVYNKQNSSDGCESGTLRSMYRFAGSLGNDACTELYLTVDNYTTSGWNHINGGETAEFTAKLHAYDPARSYTFSHQMWGNKASEFIALGAGDEPNTMRYRYTANLVDASYDYLYVYINDADDELCPRKYTRVKFKVKDLSDTCQGSDVSADGEVIIDNTASESAAILNNLKFIAGCDKDQTTLGYKSADSADVNGQGANVINIKKYQVVNKYESPWNSSYDSLRVYYGLDETAGLVESRLLHRKDKTLHHFSDGKHLFDLDHLRAAANWMSGTSEGGAPNITARSEAVGELDVLEPGTYGTITMRQFLENIRDGKTMYGIVRVLVGLEKGTCGDDCESEAYNGLGLTADESTIYGFCGGDTTTGLCDCSPSSRPSLTPGNHFSKIKPGLELCNEDTDGDGIGDGDPIVLPDDAKIMVKGALIWDFVDYSEKDESDNYKTIPLNGLPFFPRELYFMVDVPIVINSTYEHDYCGGIDYVECGGNKLSSDFLNQIADISHITTKYKDANPYIYAKYIRDPHVGITFDQIPQVSRDYYKFITGDELTADVLASLHPADRYHLMMPNGYEEGWADAFKHLQITAAEWKALDFMVPENAPTNEPLSVDHLRLDTAQDVPVYLYSGGLIDMHSHVNISGLVYVPQAMEIEAETEDNIRQAVFGAIVLKDGYFIKAKNNSITIISNYSNTYRSIKTANKIIQRKSYVGSGIEGLDYETGEAVEDTEDDCLWCTNSSAPDGTGGEGMSASQKVNNNVNSAPPRRWQRIVPQNVEQDGM